MTNPVLNTRNYAKFTGIVIAAVALVGIILNAIGNPDVLGANFLAFDWTHNILHVVLAAAGLYVGFAGTDALCTLYARVFGVVYLLLGITGFFWTGVSATMLHLELGENLLHALVGAWGCAAGFLGAKTTAPTTTTPTPMRK